MKLLKLTCACAALAGCGAVWAGSLEVGGAKLWPGARTGSWLKPFETLEEARDAIRAARAAGDTDTWTVTVRGMLGRTETFTLDARDHDIVFRGAGDGAGLSGARTLTGWKVRPDGAWEADIPATDGVRDRFEALWNAAGERLARARFPKTGYTNVLDVAQTAITNVVDGKKSVVYEQRVKLQPPMAAVFANVSPAALAAVEFGCNHYWSAELLRPHAFEPETGTLVLRGEKYERWNPWAKGSLYYVENAPNALTEPGEWLYDAVAGKVRYLPRPGENPATAVFRYAVPGLRHLVRFTADPSKKEYVRRVRFENLSFLHSDSPKVGPGTQAASWAEGALELRGADSCALTDCTIAATGEYGLNLGAGCRSNTVSRCRIADLGAGGVRIGLLSHGGAFTRPRRDTHVTYAVMRPHDTFDNTVDNCLIENGGLRYAEGVGVGIGHSAFNRVTHNEIRNFRYTGVSVGWTWGYGGSICQGNEIAFNHIHHIGQRHLADMGGVYMLGQAFGSRVTDNVIHDVDSYSYGGWGLYTDEGSEGVVMTRNLVFDTKSGSFHQHYGKENTLVNNIFLNASDSVMQATRIETNHCVFVVKCNVIATWKKSGMIINNWNPAQKTSVWDGNLYFSGTNPAKAFAGKGIDHWKEKKDARAVFADPLFVDREAYDFRLKEDSPAFALGFKAWDYSKAGLYGKMADRHGALSCRRERAGCPFP